MSVGYLDCIETKFLSLFILTEFLGIACKRYNGNERMYAIKNLNFLMNKYGTVPVK